MENKKNCCAAYDEALKKSLLSIKRAAHHQGLRVRHLKKRYREVVQTILFSGNHDAYLW